MSVELEQKQLFRNEDGGHVGAVQIGPEGKPAGVGIEPGGHIWLSEIEQRLTANAPRDPKDNPFVKQTRVVTDPTTGVMSEVEVIPLVPVHDTRYVPGTERPVPGIIPEDAVPAPQAPPEPQETRVTPAPSETAPSVPRVPPRAAAAIAGQPATPAMQGLTPPMDPVLDDADPLGPSFGAAPTTTPQEDAMNELPSEEQAAAVDPAIGEETGAATPPVGEPPEGHYQAQEEVGTPTTPPPYTPEG